MLITDYLALGHVPRWSIVRIDRPQSVAEHSFNVAGIVRELHERLQLDSAKYRLDRCVHWALYHDVDESITGDIPGNAKGKMVEVKLDIVSVIPLTITRDEYNLVKLADRIESYTWIAMHGRGAHAAEVMSYTHAQMLCCSLYANGTAERIERLCDDIMNERERLR